MAPAPSGRIGRTRYPSLSEQPGRTRRCRPPWFPPEPPADGPAVTTLTRWPASAALWAWRTISLSPSAGACTNSSITIPSRTYAGFRLALQDQHDLGDVGVEVGGDQLLVQPSRAAPAWSFHHPSGRAPTTFAPVNNKHRHRRLPRGTLRAGNGCAVGLRSSDVTEGNAIGPNSLVRGPRAGGHRLGRCLDDEPPRRAGRNTREASMRPSTEDRRWGRRRRPGSSPLASSYGQRQRPPVSPAGVVLYGKQLSPR